MHYARQFNPCMFYSGPDIWSVEVNYAWAEGAPLMAVLKDEQGKIVRSYQALPASALTHKRWDNLPTKSKEYEIFYFIDAPGTNLGPGENEQSWTTAFQRIQKNMSNPKKAAYPPTQYVYAYWWDKSQRELALAYWFYYPFDKWMNNHEGDWEHIQVILKAPLKIKQWQKARPLRFHYQHHGFGEWWTQPLVTIFYDKEGNTGYHPAVFVGGKAVPRLFPPWTGLYSGASYPAPGVFNLFAVTADVSHYARAIHANDFQLILLREKELMKQKLKAKPDLSWLFLPVYFGELQVKANHKGIIKMRGNKAPSHPFMRSSLRNGPKRHLLGKNTTFLPFTPPQGWRKRAD